MTGTSLRFVAITLITSGCVSLYPYDPGPGMRVAATVPAAAYLPGEHVNVTIANLSEVELLYPGAFCQTELQKKDRGGWVTVVPHNAAGCPIEIGFLDPQQAVVHQYRLPADLDAGTYRLSMPMPVPDEARAREAPLTTRSFAIQGLAARTTTASVAASP